MSDDTRRMEIKFAFLGPTATRCCSCYIMRTVPVCTGQCWCYMLTSG